MRQSLCEQPGQEKAIVRLRLDGLGEVAAQSGRAFVGGNATGWRSAFFYQYNYEAQSRIPRTSSRSSELTNDHNECWGSDAEKGRFQVLYFESLSRLVRESFVSMQVLKSLPGKLKLKTCATWAAPILR